MAIFGYTETESNKYISTVEFRVIVFVNHVNSTILNGRKRNFDLESNSTSAPKLVKFLIWLIVKIFEIDHFIDTN